ncbi:hypothetical protein CR513_40639, partial [Mucuna pruriens]
MMQPSTCVYSNPIILLDLKYGYYQNCVRKDIFENNFLNSQGIDEFIIDSTFESFINVVFMHCLRKHVLMFVDDILVYNNNCESYSTFGSCAKLFEET